MLTHFEVPGFAFVLIFACFRMCVLQAIARCSWLCVSLDTSYVFNLWNILILTLESDIVSKGGCIADMFLKVETMTLPNISESVLSFVVQLEGNWMHLMFFHKFACTSTCMQICMCMWVQWWMGMCFLADHSFKKSLNDGCSSTQ